MEHGKRSAWVSLRTLMLIGTLSVALVLSACSTSSEPVAEPATGDTGAAVEAPAEGEAGATEEPGGATEEITETEDMTETEGVEGSDMVTETEDMTGTEDTTGMGAGAATVNISTGDQGDYLADAEGRTYYSYAGDAEPSELGDFERVQAGEADSVGEGLSQDMLGTEEVDGTSYLTYNDRPLYRNNGDVNPGDITGQGFNDEWYTVNPQGELNQQ